MYLLQRDNCQKVGRNYKPDWVDVNDGESPAFVRRQTCGCSNTDATTRLCHREEGFILREMGGDTSGASSRVKELKLSSQGEE